MYGRFPLDAFQSTPLMRGETKDEMDAMRKEMISIHSPHARGDKYPQP